MGRRYGRNQKRKHRERIAALEERVENTERSLEGAKDVSNRLANDLAFLHAELNRLSPYSAFLPAKFFPAQPDQFKCNFYRAPRPMVGIDLNPPGAPPEDRFFIDVLDIPMLHVVTHIRQNPGSFETAVHFEVRSPQKTYGRIYYMSAEALRKDGGRGYVIERIVTTCILEILEEMDQERQTLGV